MNNEAINRLRIPAAWALLGAVAATMVAGMISIFSGMGGPGGSAGLSFAAGGGSVFSPVNVLLVVVAVLLAVTAPQRSTANSGIVVFALVLLGVGALFALITLIMSFVAAADGGIALAFTQLFEIGGAAAVIVFAALFLFRVFNDPNLVPRPQPQAMPQQGMPQGYAPATGAQQSFADPYAQQGYADPAQAYGTGAQAAYGDAYQQQYVQGDPYQQAAYADPQQAYADPAAQQQAAYGDAYQQQAQAYGTGGQPAYGDAYQQQAQAYGTGGQPAYGDAYQQAAYGDAYQQQGQQAYDAYGQQQAQAYGTGGQPAYGDAYQQQAQAYGTGGQPAYGDAYQQQAQAYGTGGQPAYGDAYQQQAQQGQYDPYAQQQAYDPSQYAPQADPAHDAGDQARPAGESSGDQQSWYRDDNQR